MLFQSFYGFILKSGIDEVNKSHIKSSKFVTLDLLMDQMETLKEEYQSCYCILFFICAVKAFILQY